MKPPILEMILKCENATSRRCECRCGGKAHGGGRSPDELRALPKDDPHYLPTEEEAALMVEADAVAQRKLIDDMRKRNPDLC